MHFTDNELDMLISGCVHYRNVYGDLADKSAVARGRKQAFIDLRDRLTAHKDERTAYLDTLNSITLNRHNSNFSF